ncbi:MAG: hypothetical protein KF795_15435 [Labilithrix sp.]|nr:hypothetical protein [Labilithrix sp.]
MGTSKSYGGPKDVSGLLPAWAIGGAEAVPAADDGAGAAEVDADVGSATDLGTSPSEAPVDARAPDRPWVSAKRQLGKVVQAGGTRAAFVDAGRAYVRARGGASQASSGASSGRRATAALGGFLSGIATQGVRPALERLGLALLAGRDAHEVFAAITNAIAPGGASLEEAVARRATTEVLQELYERYAVETDGIAKLDAMGVEDIREAIQSSIASYVYHRWLEELGAKIEEKSVSAREAERLERDMKAYVQDVVRLDLAQLDLLTIDWGGRTGSRLMEELYAQAYAVLGGSTA